MKLEHGTTTDRLAHILYLGLIEIRNLASPEKHQQVFDLADALEIVPRYLNNPSDDELELIRFALGRYREKYPGARFNYLQYLEGVDVPEVF